MEDVHPSRNEKTQEIEEEEITARLVETRLDQLGFQVTLEDPLHIVASSSSEVTILSSKGSATTTETRWPIGKVIEEIHKKVREEMQKEMTSHSVPYHTRLLASLDLERNQMKFSLQHPLAQSLPSLSQLKALEISLDLTSVPLPYMINFHRKVWDMLYSELNRNAMTISKAEKLLEKATTRLKQERAESRSLHMQNESLKELIMKLGVNLEDKVAFEALLQSSKAKIQDLRQKLKMSASEHVKSKELA